MKIIDFEKNYLSQNSLLEHSKLVSRLSLKLFSKLINFFPFLEEYNNEKDLKILETAALLHDIGVPFEDKKSKGHHKIGRDLILKNKITEFDEAQNLVVANIVRYHRRALPKEEHKYFKILSEENKRKTEVFASIVRLCDSIDFCHFNLVEDFETKYDKFKKILTIMLPVNIMLNIGLRDNLNKKKEFLELVFNIEVLFN